MNLLLIGDPHFRLDNIVESQKFISEVERVLTSRDDIDVVVVLGDVLHTHEKLHTFALNSAVQFFEMLTKYKPVYCLVGNHDATSNTIFLTDNHWLNVFKGWKGLTVVDKPLVYTTGRKQVLMCPYVPDGRFQEALDHVLNWKEMDLIIGHQLLDGAKMGPIVASGVEEWRLEWPLLISGHIHDKQRPQANLFYTGSSMQHAFGESSDKTLYLYHLKSKEGEEIELQIPRKEILYVDVKDLDQIEEKVQHMIDEDISVKIVVRGDLNEMKAAKDTESVRRLEKVTGVKAVVFKTSKEEKDKRDKAFTERADDLTEQSFESILRHLVAEKEDHYLDSLLQHMLSGAEDLSDKDVFFV